jgi:hypothetical protein
MGFALFGLIALGCVAVLVFVLGRPLVAAAVYRLFRDPDPYPPEAAEAPPMACGCARGSVQYFCLNCNADRCEEHRDQPHECVDSLGEHFKTAPREQRIDQVEVDRLVEQFDWPRYATWLKEPS